ncbi:right-handed parallel beta-helix repeat-containing protein [Halomicrococcus sp. SG-WS-1]|uniref:right-handed parallel beta-helix repeat-containing protein n=1 Tax=Halomicrococcus sp. SG-WS-1 TaxID=3439057 RepID=UPI003F7A3667
MAESPEEQKLVEGNQFLADTTEISVEAFQLPARYIIYEREGSVRALNAETQLEEFVGSFSEVLQTVLDLLGDRPGTVYIRSGKYQVSSEIKIDHSKTGVVGEQGAELQPDAGTNGLVVSAGVDDVLIKNLIFFGDADSQSGNHIYVGQSANMVQLEDIRMNQGYTGIFVNADNIFKLTMDNLRIVDMNNNGVDITGSGNEIIVKNSVISLCGDTGLSLFNTKAGVMRFHNVDLVDHANYPLFIGDDGNTFRTEHKRFVGCNFEGLDVHSRTVNVSNAADISFEECKVSGMVEHGYLIDSSQEIRIIGGRAINNDFDDQGSYGGYGIHDSEQVIIAGVQSTDTHSTGSKTQTYGIIEYGTSDNNLILGNDLKGNKTRALDLSGISTTERDNLGWLTKNTDASTFSGDGASTTFVVSSHGLAQSPSSRSRIHAEATPVSSDAVDASPIEIYPVDDDNDGNYEALEIKFSNAPASGTDNVGIRWKTELEQS